MRFAAFRQFPSGESMAGKASDHATVSSVLVEVGRHRNIEIHTLREIKEVSGKRGSVEVALTKRPGYLDAAKYTGCGVCLEACPIPYEVQLPVVEGLIGKEFRVQGPP
jgi:heterodisulfide reductase subunit A-like polyferredoxin